MTILDRLREKQDEYIAKNEERVLIHLLTEFVLGNAKIVATQRGQVTEYTFAVINTEG